MAEQSAYARWTSWAVGLGNLITYGVWSPGQRELQRGDTLPDGRSTGGFSAGRSKVDWRAEAPAEFSPIVNACVNYVARGMSEARLYVEDSRNEQDVGGHPALDMLYEPNDRYDGYTLLESFIGGAMAAGDSFIVEERDSRFNLSALQWVSRRQMEPLTLGGKHGWPERWAYLLENGGKIAIQPDDLIWMRWGLSLADNALPRSLAAIADKEVALAQAIALYAARTMRTGLGAAAVFEAEHSLGSDEAQQLKAQWDSQIGGDNAGGIIAVGGGKINPLGIAPRDARTSDLTVIAETIIPALYGLNPMALGLQTGVRFSAYATKLEADRDAWSHGVLSALRRIESVLNPQYLWREYDPDRRLRLRFDVSGVRALQESEDAKAARVQRDWELGIATHTEARVARGYPEQPEGEAEYRQQTGALGLQADAPFRLLAPALTLTPGEDLRAALLRLHEARALALTEPMRGVLLAAAERAVTQAAEAVAAAGGSVPAGALVFGALADETAAVTAPASAVTAEGVAAAINAAGVLPEKVAVSEAMLLLVRQRAAERAAEIAGTRIEGWNELVRDRQALGWTPQQIIDGDGPLPPGVPDRPGLRQALGEQDYRGQAETIARTETSYAQVEAASTMYAEQGVTHVRVVDGIEDAPCAAANGQTWTIAEMAGNPVAHPRCTRSFEPVLTGSGQDG